ncbi:MAG TPA: hypothetical protein VFM58_18650 [Solirubrobacteraceae bacterium]|nr:hypothetical protein [Solirubrobacteraceae bacterium]
MTPAAAVRAFGAQPGDLDVDFDSDDRATVATEVIARCAAIGHEGAWALPVGTRLALLVAVAQLCGRHALRWTLPCAADDCDEEIEVELPLATLAAAARAGEATEPATVGWGGHRFRPRRPTGEDLRRWHAQPPSDAEIVAAVGGPELAGDAPPELVAAVEAALDAVDPLVDTSLRSTCPACGRPLALQLDIEAALLADARARQDRLLEDVAALAAAFHWSEPEILALPPRRRRRYLALVEAA